MIHIFKSKKGDVKLIGKIALVLFIILFLTTLSSRGMNRFNDATENCPGTCKLSCDVDEIQFNSKCIIGGVEEVGVCCTGVNDREDSKNSPNTTTNNTPNTTNSEVTPDVTNPSDVTNPIEIQKQQNPKISVRLGEGDDLLSSANLHVGTKFKFTINTEGENINKCEIKLLNPINNEEIESGNFAISQEEKNNCENIILEIEPTMEDFNLLKQQDGWARINMLIRLSNNTNQNIHSATYNFILFPQQ